MRVVRTGSATPPDLNWSSTLTVPTPVNAAESFTIDRTYEVTQEPAGPDFDIAYVRSTDATYGNGDDVALGIETIDTAGGKNVGTHAGVSGSMSIVTAGTYWVFGVLDAGGAVTESDEGNNVAVTSAQIEVRAVALPPQIDSLSITPNPAEIGQTVTLTALGVTDPDGTVSSLTFYEDTDGSGSLEIATDAAVGTDTDGSDGWSASVDTTGFSAGTYRYFAQALDNESNPSNVVTATVDVTAPVAEWIVDNGDAGYNEENSWKGYSRGYQGSSRYWYSGTGESTAQWAFGGLASGTYAVYVTWTGGSTRPDNAPYTVADGGAPLATVPVNQQLSPDDDQSDNWWWESVGEYAVISGTLTVTLSNQCNGTYVISDAVRVVRTG